MFATTENCKYVFTNPELVEIARDQARLINEKVQAEEQFANVRADHKATITRLDAEISQRNLRLTSGYEMRNVKCVLLKFRPDRDSALVVRTDNGRVIRKRRLEAEEKQMELSTSDPILYLFEADFFEDGTSDVAEMVADHVPLTAKEAEALRESGITLKPLRPLLGDGEASERRGKRGKDAGAGN